VAVEERVEVGEPISSSPSMMTLTLTGSSPRACEPGADRGDVREDPGLVVGGAAAVEAAVALGRLERRRGPPVGVPTGWTSWWA
jgi:hypothetical protein